MSTMGGVSSETQQLGVQAEELELALDALHTAGAEESVPQVSAQRLVGQGAVGELGDHVGLQGHRRAGGRFLCGYGLGVRRGHEPRISVRTDEEVFPRRRCFLYWKMPVRGWRGS